MIQKLRISSLIGIHILIFFHVYYFGDSIIGSVDFQEFFHSFIKFGIINAGVILVFLAFLVTLIFGRFFCGWACHFGALQEFSWWILKKINITPKTVNSSLVTILPLFILINFYIAPNLIYSISAPWKEITINLAAPGIWEFLPGFFIGLLTFVVDGFLIVYFLGRKGFCRFLCPWGAFLKIPNSFAMFKVRNNSGCVQSGQCTTNCPVGIDVSYEINNFDKVSNTNCTSCLICTEGCPSGAISYKWINPIKENFQFNHYKLNLKKFNLPSFSKLFKSVHSKDYWILPLVLFFGFSIDGLYGMGHFLSFGIALIAASQLIIFNKKNNLQVKLLLNFFIVSIFSFHGIIKFSIWRGLEDHENKKYSSAISHLNRVVTIYPKNIGRFHILLSEMYLEMNNIDLAVFHAEKAKKINPMHHAPNQLLLKINTFKKK